MTKHHEPTREPPLKGRYRLEFADEFDGDRLDPSRWLSAHLPQWSSRKQAAARYCLRSDQLVLQILEDQPPWCPEFDGGTRVSSLQTGVYSGPTGTVIGQHRFNEHVVVREEQAPERLYTPLYGCFEMRAKAVADASNMVAFWMIGYEDVPEHSGEICICEIFGSDVETGEVRVGMGVHPFTDPHLNDDFSQVRIDIDVTEFHVYAAEWSATHVDFFVDGRQVKTVRQSPNYPMQLMLGIYEFDAGRDEVRPGVSPYPKEFVVDYVRGFRPP
jgi:glycosyl hydrolase family 16